MLAYTKGLVSVMRFCELSSGYYGMTLKLPDLGLPQNHPPSSVQIGSTAREIEHADRRPRRVHNVLLICIYAKRIKNHENKPALAGSWLRIILATSFEPRSWAMYSGVSPCLFFIAGLAPRNKSI